MHSTTILLLFNYYYCLALVLKTCVFFRLNWFLFILFFAVVGEVIYVNSVRNNNNNPPAGETNTSGRGKKGICCGGCMCTKSLVANPVFGICSPPRASEDKKPI